MFHRVYRKASEEHQERAEELADERMELYKRWKRCRTKMDGESPWRARRRVTTDEEQARVPETLLFAEQEEVEVRDVKRVGF